MATKVTADGRVTIPKPIQDYLGIGPGSTVDFQRDDNGRILLVAANDATLAENRFARFLGHAGPGPSTDEVMEILRGEP